MSVCMHAPGEQYHVHPSPEGTHTEVSTHLCGEVWEHSSRWVSISFELKIKKDLQKLPLLEGYH